nr:PhzF family isomerase [uncultured Anaeromusa sp.]
MRTYTIYQVDAFTTESFKGNPAGVVTNADGLNEKEMLSIARELNNSETAFLFSPDAPDHEVRIRYFTPLTEVPVCGHATIASHYVRAVEGQMDSTISMHKIGVGTLPVEIVRYKDNYSIIMTQGAISFERQLTDTQRQRLLAALGLAEADMDERCPVEVVSTGHSKVMVGIRQRSKLDVLSPDLAGLKELSAEISCNGYFVFTLDSQVAGVLSHGRMFAPAIGIAEDPVTGNANGPLGAYLVKHKLVAYEGNQFCFKGEQGSAIGRSGIVDVYVKVAEGEPVQVRIGGEAVIVFKTEITL